MLRALVLLVLAGAGGAESASSGVFRCLAPDGRIRFADSPHRCPRGSVELDTPADRLQSFPDAPDARGQSLPAAPDTPGNESGPAPRHGLDAIWLSAAEIGPGWDVVREAPVDPSADPDLVAWGVRVQDARHYTRDRDGSVQVCSVELWSFSDAARAEAAHQGFAHPGWRIGREGHLLVMLRGLTLTRGSEPSRGVFEDCARIGDRIQRRARPAP
jgi:hypothetical protein